METGKKKKKEDILIHLIKLHLTPEKNIYVAAMLASPYTKY